jgi:ribose 5-phosphate isomerase B
MAENGRQPGLAAEAHVLRWPGRVLAADDVRRSLNGHREVLLGSTAIVTPMAQEELRARGVAVRRQPAESAAACTGKFGVAQERQHPTVQSAVQALRRDGVTLVELSGNGTASCERWARAVGECVARGECQGGVVFCEDPGLVCCVTNKLAGLRAVAVATVGQAARATLTLGANLLAVEMPGRTFFEARQILRILCAAGQPSCPPGVACTLKELEDDAHR